MLGLNSLPPVSTVRLFAFRVPLSRTLPGRPDEWFREGLLIEAELADGRKAVAEASPLPGFSRESLHETKVELVRWCRAAVDGNAATPVLAAANFAVGSLLRQLADQHNTNQRENDPNQRDGHRTHDRDIELNALVTADPQGQADAIRLYRRGFRTFKVKVGRGDSDSEASVAASIAALGEDVKIRIDSNRAWHLVEAVSFARQLLTVCGRLGRQNDAVAYFEEPLSDPTQLARFVADTGIRVALDESIREARGTDVLDPGHVVAAVLKPSLGGWTHTEQIISLAKERGIDCVISSSFESGVGLAVLARLASNLTGSSVPVGLGTYDWIARDVLSPRPALDGPRIHPIEPEVLASTLNRAQLSLLVEEAATGRSGNDAVL